MLSINNLEILHKKELRTLVHDLSFTVNKGDKLCIVGDEGTGKSTLIKYLYGIELDYVKITGNKICSFEKIEYLPQFIEEKYLNITVEEYLFKDLDDYNMIYMLASKLDFEIEDKKIYKLSGGEKVKMQLLKIMSKKPDLLLLDEPSNDIDKETIEYLEKFLNNINIATIFISHDESLLSNISTKIIHINKKDSIYESLSYDEYVDERLRKFNYDLKVSTKQRKEYDKKVEQLNIVKEKVDKIQYRTETKYAKKYMHTLISRGKRFEREKENFVDIPQLDKAIVFKFSEIEDFECSNDIFYIDEKNLKLNNNIELKNISFSISSKDKVVIIGRNGSGKTTFLKYIYEIIRNKNGLKVGYMPQEYSERLDYSITPLEYLKKFEEKKTKTFLASMGFDIKKMNTKIENLSGGEKAKILLLELELEACNVLILDEPTRNLSPLSQPVLRKIFSEYNGCIISVSHDRRFIEEVCNKIIKID